MNVFGFLTPELIREVCQAFQKALKSNYSVIYLPGLWRFLQD